MEAAVIALNQKVVDKFLKVCAEGQGARQGTQLQCPVSPLLSREVDHSLPPFCSSIAENMICAKWRPTTDRYSLPHRLSNSIMTSVQDISNHIPQSKSIYRNPFWPMFLFPCSGDLLTVW